MQSRSGGQFVLLCVYISVWMGFLQIYHRRAHRGTLEDIHQDLSTNAVRCMRLFVKKIISNTCVQGPSGARDVFPIKQHSTLTHTHTQLFTVCLCLREIHHPAMSCLKHEENQMASKASFLSDAHSCNYTRSPG